MEQYDAADLLARYQAGTCTPEERAHIERWWLYYQDGATDALTDAEVQNDLQHIRKSLPGQHRTKVYSYRVWRAAAILLLASIGIYFYKFNTPSTDIRPGYNQATLTLANGRTISLDSAQSGIIVSDEDIKYNDGTKIKSPSHHSKFTTYNSLSTPKGGQYQIILSDGTKVWLNAASTLKYPSRFSGDNREVFLEGEGYFEIKEDNTKPFKVLSNNQEILVLGTSFNVTAFADEKETKTTLVEGKVQVRSQNLQRKTYHVQLLSPKQQAMVKGDSLTVSTVDVNKETAWRNGLIAFNDEPLEAIMRKVARWYNVEVTYSPDANRRVQISGSVSRYVNISDVLKRLELTGFAHFAVEGRRIFVAK